MPHWYEIAAPSYSGTDLEIKAKKQSGQCGAYMLTAYRNGVVVHFQRFEWNVWVGHAGGQLLMPDFVAAAERAAHAASAN